MKREYLVELYDLGKVIGLIEAYEAAPEDLKDKYYKLITKRLESMEGLNKEVYENKAVKDIKKIIEIGTTAVILREDK